LPFASPAASTSRVNSLAGGSANPKIHARTAADLPISLQKNLDLLMLIGRDRG
jgi:hypothetical protein